MDLTDFAKQQGAMDFTQLDMDRIVDEVRKLGVSYSSEISRRLMIHKEKVTMLFHQLILTHQLKVLPTPPYDVPPAIHKRLSYFHAMGLQHNWQFMQRQWVVLDDVEKPAEEEVIKEHDTNTKRNN